MDCGCGYGTCTCKQDDHCYKQKQGLVCGSYNNNFASGRFNAMGAMILDCAAPYTCTLYRALSGTSS